MMLVAGFDISTTSITSALIPMDPQVNAAVRWGAEPVQWISGNWPTSLLDVRRATKELCRGQYISLAVVEEPRGPYAARQLNAIYGAVIASIPTHITAVMGLDPQTWRRTLGLPLRMTKDQAILAAMDAWDTTGATNTPPPSHHHADALLIALAGRTLCWKHAA